MLATPQENPHHIYDVGMHTIKALSYLAGHKTARDITQAEDTYNSRLSLLTQKEDTILRLALLLHDCAKPMDKYIDSDGIAHFVGHDYDGAILADKILRRLKFDNETIRAVTHLVRMHDTRYGELGRSVNGSDLIKAGIKPGPDIGAWLDRLLNYVIEYPEKNNREELLFMLNTWREEPPQKKDLQSFR